jgi:acetoacetyl-CoA synthetase
MLNEPQPLWRPSKERVAGSALKSFIRELPVGEQIESFEELYRWSLLHREQFWKSVWDFVGIKASALSDSVVTNPTAMPGARWFEGAALNFAENLLKRGDDHTALIFRSEDKVRRTLTYRELRAEVSRVAAFLKTTGVTAGDRVAGYLPNMPETIIAMLATTSIGAIWSSCSPDFGVSGVVDRFGQIAPKVLVVADGYYFKGSPINCLDKVTEIVSAIPSITKVLVAPLVAERPAITSLSNAVAWHQLPAAGELHFEQLPFNHPLYIMYSSGTTGKPKCIVHGAGGTLLEHLKELVLHTDLTSQDTFMYQTTCGWMMWNWMVSALAVGCTVVLYDGSPLHRGGNVIFDILQDEKVSVYGTSAKFLALAEKEGITPARTHNLSALHTVLSTGSPLLPESFDYVYRGIKADVCLSSIAGGTDIIGCFTLGSPISPVYHGETQVLSLGLPVQVFSPEGKPLKGEKGELVCTGPFPSMPIYFWGDEDGVKYRKAYFEKFPGVWHHGDFVMQTEHGGLVFFGRSDALLKPGGVRIGSAEIYRQVETLPEVIESVVVGQEWEGDTRIVLFVRLAHGHTLSPELVTKIQKTIRENTSPFHVPKKVLAVTAIPVTRSNKVAELAVRETIHGRPVPNTEALANPESLEQFKGRVELAN